MAPNFGLGQSLRLINPNFPSNNIVVTDSLTRILKNIINGNYGQNYKEYDVYHLWLECLYKIDLKFSDIICGLERLLDTKAKRKLIDIDRIFVIGHKHKDGTIKPAGSCFILISNLINGSPAFEDQLFDLRVKMIQVSYQTLTEQLKNNLIIMLVEETNMIKNQPAIEENHLNEKVVENNDQLTKDKSKVVSSRLSKPVPSSNIPINVITNQIKRIKTKDSAYAIARKYSKSNYVYIRFHVFGTIDLIPDLLESVLPKNSVYTNNIFLHDVHNFAKHNEIAGVIAIDMNYNGFINNNGRRTFKLDDNVHINIKRIDINGFRSTVLDFNKIYRFLKDSDLEEYSSPRAIEGSNSPTKISRRQRKRVFVAQDNNVKKSKVNSKPSKFSENIDKNLLNNPIKLEEVLNNALEDEDKVNDFVSEKSTNLKDYGSSVVKVLNLPYDLTIHQLNLLLGTYTLNEKQVVAVKRSQNGRSDMMDIMIVMRPENPDRERILKKDHLRTPQKTTLVCQMSNTRELERFLKKNHNNLLKLKNLDTLPTQVVGYNVKGIDLTTKINNSNETNLNSQNSIQQSLTIPTPSTSHIINSTIVNGYIDHSNSSDLKEDTLSCLMKYGNCIIRVDNLLAKTSMQRFNQLFGTYTITTSQVIALIKPNKRGDDLMELRIVLDEKNLDVPRIMNKHLTETSYGEYLICKRTSISELETFIKENENRICDMKSFNTSTNDCQ